MVVLVLLVFSAVSTVGNQVNVRVHALLFCGEKPVNNVNVSLLNNERFVKNAQSANYENEILITAKNVYYRSKVSIELRHHCDGGVLNTKCDRLDRIELGYRNDGGHFIAHFGRIDLANPHTVAKTVDKRVKITIKEHNKCQCYKNGHVDFRLKSCEQLHSTK
ncbi:hypothetical protein Tcan_15770 [Toxocara canis]|uniref:Uncharacterized protein n=1 Tax=Toxocara canis TaxID=6265 RepID=A0A0B2VCX9_TOXCA|nr:hypothetical protein Tcan_15770 [Toxocara canis]